MSYIIVEEESTGFPTQYYFAIQENGYVLDRAKTKEEAQELLDEMEQYDKEQAWLEDEVGFLVDEFRNKFDLAPIHAEKRFVEYVKDWL